MARSKEVSPSKHSKDSEIKTSKDKTVDLSPKTKGAKVEKTKSGKDDGAGKNKSKLAFESVLVDDAKIKDKSTSEMVAKKNKSDSKRAGSKTGNDGEDTAGLAPDSVVEEEESARSQTTLFVRNLPNNFTSEDLEAAFSEIGPLRSAFVVGGRDFGFVRFAIREDAARAVDELHGKSVKSSSESKKIRVEYAVPKGATKETKDKAKPKPKEKKAGKKDEEKEAVAVGSPADQSTKKRKRDATTGDDTSSAPHLTKRTVPVVTLLVSNLPKEDIDPKKILYKKIRKLIPSTLHPLLHPRIVQHPFNNDPAKALIHLPDFDLKQNTADANSTKIPSFILSKLQSHELHGSTLSLTQHQTHLAKRPKHKPADWSLPENLDSGLFDNAPVVINGIPITVPKLIVRNLHFSTREHHLASFFAIDSGNKPTVTLGPPRADGKPSGFGFVTYQNIADAKRGIQKNGEKLLGRTVAVDWSLPKNVWEEVKKDEEAMEGKEEEEEEENGGGSASKDEEGSDAASDSGSSSESEDGVDVTFDSPSSSASSSSDEDDEDGEEQDKKEITDTDDGTTLFIRNLAFETTEDEVRDTFKVFGRLRYARLVVDPFTKKPRGTAFVRFLLPESAQACLDKFASCEPPSRDLQHNKRDPHSQKSILEPEPALSTPFHLHNRFLHVLPAVSRSQSSQLSQQTRKELRVRDKRNLYLLKEGLILPGTDASEGLSQAELGKRQDSYSSRKQQLEKNPNLFVSKTRLALRNLWVGLSEGELKKLCKGAVVEFDKQVERGERKALDKDLVDSELALEQEQEAAQNSSALSKKQKKKSKSTLKQAKLLLDPLKLDPSTSQPKSKGIAFVEFTTHLSALKCLRFLNNNPLCYSVILGKGEEEAKKRPIVEFAVENMLIVKKREERVDKSRKGHFEKDGKKEWKEKDGKVEKREGGNKRKREEDGEQGARGDGPVNKKVRHERWNQSSKMRNTEASGAGKKELAKDKPAKSSEPKKQAQPSQPSKPQPQASKELSSKPSPQAALPVVAAQPSKKKQSREQREEASFDTMVDRYKRNLFG